MKIVCDNCATKYSIADEKVRGKVFKIKCKKCSHIIVVKGQELAAEPTPAGFDQKETRVFDYSGFEGGKDTAAAEPIWYVVVDKEQIGPLTVGEVAHKWTSGEIDTETYTWREGFDDWRRLGSVDELAAIMKGPEPARTDGLFGGTSTPSLDTTQQGRADPTDLFAGAGSSTEDESPSDLFGGRAPAPQPAVFASAPAPAAASPARRSAPSAAVSDEQPLFSVAHADADGGVGVETAAASKVDVRPMTAQRNENSVLFSLNNLAALASGGDGGVAAAPKAASSGLGSFAASGPEGSGLIDIRAMAAMTLGATSKKDEGGPRAMNDDDLPVFSASSFSTPASAVLLPTVKASSNRTLYTIIAVFGVAVLAMLILMMTMLLGKKPAAVVPPAPQPVVAVTPTSPTPAATPTPTPAPPSASTPPPASATPPPPAPPPHEERVTAPKPPPRHERPAPSAAPPAPAPTPTDTKPSSPPASEPPKPVAPQKCDEVACLVTPDLPCCPKKGQAHPAAQPTASAADPGLPDRLDQSDIIAGMKNVSTRVMSCNDRFHVAGAFKVKVTVASDGSVQAATASPPVAGTGAASCVESAVRGAHFKRSKNSITFNYPYTFR
jgi:predicted Zn finger-like uncharacterized protein